MSPSDALVVYPFGTVLQHERKLDVIFLVLHRIEELSGHTLGNNYHAIQLSGEGFTVGDMTIIGQNHPSDWIALEYPSGWLGNVR